MSPEENLKIELEKERMLLRYVLREYGIECYEDTLNKIRFEVDLLFSIKKEKNYV